MAVSDPAQALPDLRQASGAGPYSHMHAAWAASAGRLRRGWGV